MNPMTGSRPTRLRWRSALACTALLLAPAAQAGPQAAAEAAWGCIKANGKAVAQGAQTGVRVLTFIATKPLCVAQLVTPPPAVPQVAMGITVGVATQQQLTSYSACSGRIYGFVAHPVLGAVKSALDQAPQVPPPLDHLKDGLADLAADNAVELLTSIPGAEVVTGGIDCGCALVDAGLQPDTVVQMVATTKQVAQQCTDVLEELGPVGQGIAAVGGAVSTAWRDSVKNPQHMPYQQYYDRFWASQVEGLAQKLIQPGSQDWTPTVKPLWDRCVDYFDSHNQYRDTARVTCDSMRDGVHIFPQRGFVQAVNLRTWQLAVPGAVENYARYLAQQQGDYARANNLGHNRLTLALSAVIFRDFGLTPAGAAPRDGHGNPQWIGGGASLGAKAMAAVPQAKIASPSVLDAHTVAMSSVIAGAYNGSALLQKVLRWQAAYPLIKAARCAIPPAIRIPGGAGDAGVPPKIRIPGTALPRVALGCHDPNVPDEARAAAVNACKTLSVDLQEFLVLSCPAPRPAAPLPSVNTPPVVTTSPPTLPVRVRPAISEEATPAPAPDNPPAAPPPIRLRVRPTLPGH